MSPEVDVFRQRTFRFFRQGESRAGVRAPQALLPLALWR